MVTLLQKWDVKVHLSNKEIGSWLPLQLTQHVKPVCGCQVKTLKNELNLPVKWVLFLVNMGQQPE